MKELPSNSKKNRQASSSNDLRILIKKLSSLEEPIAPLFQQHDERNSDLAVVASPPLPSFSTDRENTVKMMSKIDE